MEMLVSYRLYDDNERQCYQWITVRSYSVITSTFLLAKLFCNLITKGRKNILSNKIK